MSSSIGVCVVCRGQTHVTEGGDGVILTDCLNCGFRSYRLPAWFNAVCDREEEEARQRAIEDYLSAERETLNRHGGWA